MEESWRKWRLPQSRRSGRAYCAMPLRIILGVIGHHSKVGTRQRSGGPTVRVSESSPTAFAEIFCNSERPSRETSRSGPSSLIARKVRLNHPLNKGRTSFPTRRWERMFQQLCAHTEQTRFYPGWRLLDRILNGAGIIWATAAWSETSEWSSLLERLLEVSRCLLRLIHTARLFRKGIAGEGKGTSPRTSAHVAEFADAALPLQAGCVAQGNKQR